MCIICQIKQQKMMQSNQQENYKTASIKYDSQFIKIAQSLGYTQKDLIPMSVELIQKQSYQIIKNMQQFQKNFYIQRKLNIYESRRQKIIKQVTKQHQLNNKIKVQSNFNPKLREIFTQHQKRMKKNQRYNQISTRGLQSGGINRRKLVANTIDLGRRSPTSSVKSINSRTSQRSDNSVRTRSSQKSNISSITSKTSNRIKLEQVRLRQKQMEQYKKRMLKQKLHMDQLKFLKAQQSTLEKSRKIKTRSQISRTIVNENKHELQQMKNYYTKTNLQNMKFKQQTKSFYRQIKQKSIKSNKKSFQIDFIRNIKKQIDMNKQFKNRYLYQNKIRKIEQKQQLRKSQRNTFINNGKIKNQFTTMLVKERNNFRSHQEQSIRSKILHFQQLRLTQAQKRRHQSKQQKILYGLSQSINHQIVRQKRKSIQVQKSFHMQQKTNKLFNKIKQLQELDAIKKQLRQQQLKDKQVDKKMVIAPNINSIRHSWTSNKMRANFNTILF